MPYRSEQMKSLFDLPDVSFIDNDTLDAMMKRLVGNYEKRYQEITGRKISLSPSDPIRVLLYAVALDLYQTEQYVDRAGKQDLLKYSYGEFLDNLAGNRGVTRKQPAAARTTLRFALSEAKAYAVGIPAGTRATNGDGVYFQTVEYGEVSAGGVSADIEAVCTAEGIEGNGFLPGQIGVIVDPLPYVASVENVTTTEGGSALESDDSLAERVYLAPSSYSVAGPDDAYAYWAKTYSANIGSVKPSSPTPGEVVLYVLMADGSLPGAEILTGLQAYLSANKIRPMTDHVSVQAPSVAPFNIALTYYINLSDSSAALTIQTEVQKAIDDYVEWQTSEIGRDINPDALIQRVKAAGAKRVTLTAPAFTVVADAQVAQCASRNAAYGGLEDD